MRRHKVVPHAADLAVELAASSLEELFAAALEGLGGLICPEAAPAQEERISADGEPDEELLVALLSEAIFLFETQRFVPAKASVRLPAPGKAEATLLGETLDLARHFPRHAVKAATYHGLRIRRDGDIFKARVIFDV